MTPLEVLSYIAALKYGAQAIPISDIEGLR